MKLLYFRGKFCKGFMTLIAMLILFQFVVLETAETCHNQTNIQYKVDNDDKLFEALAIKRAVLPQSKTIKKKNVLNPSYTFFYSNYSTIQNRKENRYLNATSYSFYTLSPHIYYCQFII